MWHHLKNSVILLAVAGVMFGVASMLVVSFASATTKIQTSICGDFVGPTITSPISGLTTKSSTVIVSGTGEPLMSVAILSNGVPVAIVATASDGTYSVSAPIGVGVNVLTAREVDECQTVKDSDVVMVEREAVSVPTDDTTTDPPAEGSEPDIVPNPPAVPRSIRQPLVPRDNSPGFRIPTITRPLPDSVYTNRRVWVLGTAEPDSVVTIYRNGSSIARLVASKDGRYGGTIELAVGENTLQVRSEKGDKSATSEKVKVILRQPMMNGSKTADSAPLVVIAAATVGVALVGIAVVTVSNMRARRK